MTILLDYRYLYITFFVVSVAEVLRDQMLKLSKVKFSLKDNLICVSQRVCRKDKREYQKGDKGAR